MNRALLVLLGALLPPALFAADEEPLPPEQAFRFEAAAAEGGIRAEWDIADAHYLYRSKLHFTTDTPGATLGEPALPPGQIKHDEFFGEVETYHGKVSIRIPVSRTGSLDEISLTAQYQGCAEAGICYPPLRRTVKVRLPAPAASKSLLSQLLPAQAFGASADPNEPLMPDQAFQLETRMEGGTLVAHWIIAPGHYLYRDKFKFTLSEGQGLKLGAPAMPAGEEKSDEFFGRIRVFHNEVEIRLPVQRAAGATGPIGVEIGYQGCAEAGICYPPIRRQMRLELPAAGAASTTVSATPPARAPEATTAAVPQSQQDRLAASLASGDRLLTILTFFGLGLLLAFTPCVFPMVPILSSIIVGQGAGLTTRRAFFLSLTYVLAMALTYSIAGVIAGLFGANIQAAFQNPWIIGSFAAVFVALALSMFGFFELQLPSSLQSRIAEISNRQEGGSLLGVAVMGVLSALIVGPCVAPPLMGALIYIGQTGDPILGFIALFFLSLGMGAPLLAVGVSAGKFLPHAGGWMETVKAVFGVLLLGVAIWMLERVVPAAVTMFLWALLLIIPGIYMGAIEPVGDKPSGWRKLWKALGLVLVLLGALLLVGLGTGSRDPLAPLSRLSTGAAQAPQAAHLPFKRIKSEADLERELASARSAGRPVMLDFYADWCVSCKEFEKYTFSDPGVQQALAGAVVLQADVTQNDDADTALLRRFRLIGPPAILFFDRSGAERADFRVVGFQEPAEFRPRVEQALSR